MTNNGYEKIAYPETYTNEDELHNILKSMRENDPVCWLEPENYKLNLDLYLRALIWKE